MCVDGRPRSDIEGLMGFGIRANRQFLEQCTPQYIV